MRAERRRQGRAIRRARQREARTRQGLALIAAGGIAAARALEAMIGPLHDFQRAALGMGKLTPKPGGATQEGEPDE